MITQDPPAERSRPWPLGVRLLLTGVFVVVALFMLSGGLFPFWLLVWWTQLTADDPHDVAISTQVQAERIAAQSRHSEGVRDLEAAFAAAAGPARRVLTSTADECGTLRSGMFTSDELDCQLRSISLWKTSWPRKLSDWERLRVAAEAGDGARLELPDPYLLKASLQGQGPVTKGRAIGLDGLRYLRFCGGRSCMQVAILPVRGDESPAALQSRLDLLGPGEVLNSGNWAISSPLVSAADLQRGVRAGEVRIALVTTTPYHSPTLSP